MGVATYKTAEDVRKVSVTRPLPVGRYALMGLETGEPGFQFVEHFEVIVERGAVAPAMTAGGIDVERGWHVVAIALYVVVGTVHGQHGVVVVAQGDEGTRRYAGHLLVAAELLDGFLRGLLAEEVDHRAAMGEAGIHRDDGVEQNLEVGLRVVLGLRGHRRC